MEVPLCMEIHQAGEGACGGSPSPWAPGHQVMRRFSLRPLAPLRGVLLPLQQLRQAAHLQPPHSITPHLSSSEALRLASA